MYELANFDHVVKVYVQVNGKQIMIVNLNSIKDNQQENVLIMMLCGVIVAVIQYDDLYQLSIDDYTETAELRIKKDYGELPW